MSARSYKHHVCKCGWHSEAHKNETARISEQVEIHRLRCTVSQSLDVEEIGLPRWDLRKVKVNITSTWPGDGGDQ